MLVCEHEDSEAPISLYINSPGGVMDRLFAIYDVMQYVRCEVADDLHGVGGVGGGRPARGRHAGNAGSACRTDASSSTSRTARSRTDKPSTSASRRRTSCGSSTQMNEILAQAHRTVARHDPPGHRPRQHLRGGRGEGLRADRRDLRAAQADEAMPAGVGTPLTPGLPHATNGNGSN